MHHRPEPDPNGQFSLEIPGEALLDVVGDLGPVRTVGADKAGSLARQNAYYPPRRLKERGDVTRQRIDGALVWAVTGDSSIEEGGEA